MADTLLRCCSRSRSRPHARPGRSRGSQGAAAERLSRGSCSRRSIRARSTAWRRSSSRGSVLVSATNGKTTTTAMVAEILGGKLAYNHSGANLLSGVASTLLASPDAELGLFEVDEAALPEIARRVHPRVVALGNLFRDQLDRYGELEHVAEGWRGAVSALPDATLVVNADDPLIGDLARGRENTIAYGLDDPSHARESLQHAADSKYCRACGTPYEYAAAYVGHLGDYRCPNCHASRGPLAVAARSIELHGLDGSEFSLETPDGNARVKLELPGLYNIYNATAAAAIAGAVGCAARRDRGGARALHRRLRPVRADRGRRQAAADAADQEPGGCERGRADAARRLRAAPRRRRAERRDRRRPRCLLDLGRRLRAAARRARPASSSRAAARPSWRCGSPTAGSRATGSRSCRAWRRRSTAGSNSPATADELVVLPTYTAMLGLRGIVAGRGLVSDFWEKPA